LAKALLMAVVCALGAIFFLYYACFFAMMLVKSVYNVLSDTVNTIFTLVTIISEFFSSLFNRIGRFSRNVTVYIDIYRNWLNSRMEFPWSDSRTLRTLRTPISTIIRDLSYGVWYDLKEIEQNRPVFAAFKAAPDAGW